MAIQIIPSTAPNPTALLGYDGTNYYVLKVDNTGALTLVANLTGNLGLPFVQSALGRMQVLTVYDAGTYRAINGDANGTIYVHVADSALPSDAASQTTLASIYNDMELLKACIHTFNTDQLQVNVVTMPSVQVKGSNNLPLVQGVSDRLDVNVLSTTLPVGASSAANQTTEIAAINSLVPGGGFSTQTTLASVLSYLGDLKSALASIHTDQLRTDVISSALPSGAATGAKQDTQTTALQLIDDLRNALASAATDSLLVKPANDGATARALQSDASGVINVRTAYDGATWRAIKSTAAGNVTIDGVNSLANKAYGYNDRYAERVQNTAHAAGNLDIDLTAVPAGEIWIIQNVWALNATTNTQIVLKINYAGTKHTLLTLTPSAASVAVAINGSWTLKEGDLINALFVSTGLNDNCYLGANGYKMKVA